MRTNQKSNDGGHPIRPLRPKRQPWVQSSRPASMSRSPKSVPVHHHTPPVEDELLMRFRIQIRAAQKLERRHDALSVDRQARKLQRQKSGDDKGKTVKALQEIETNRQLSLGKLSLALCYF